MGGIASFSGLLCGVVVVWLVGWFFVALWVHGNAPRHGKNPLVWFLVVLLLGFIGLIAYFLVRPGQSRPKGRSRPAGKRARPESRAKGR